MAINLYHGIAEEHLDPSVAGPIAREALNKKQLEPPE